MDKEKAIEQIKKLLKHTEENGATPAEAAAAIALAQKLMAEHNIKMEKLDAEAEPEVLEEGIDVGTKSVSSIQCMFAQSLCKHFACHVIMRWSTTKHAFQLAFIGDAVNCKVFKEAYLFAYNAFKFNWDKYHRSLNLTTQQKTQARGTYLRGFIAGLTNELVKSENANALVIVESPAVTTYMDKLNLRKSSRSMTIQESNSMNDYLRGYQDGSYSQSNKNSLHD